jgi:RNA-binding motif X-linked protein 2
VITIFSQFGEPSFLKLVRDKETGKSKGFGWLKYEDQRSTDLAVDNLGGAEIGGRLIRVDHARYKARDDEDPEEFKVGWEDIMKREGKNVEEESSEEGETRPALPEERELALLIRDHDEDDPMKGFLIEEKKKEVEEARRRADKKEKRHRHKHRSHRSDRDDSDEGRSRRSRRDETLVEREWRHRDKEPRRHRGRDDSRDRERRRRRHDDDDDDQGRHRDRNRDRRRHSREGSEEPRRRRHRDDPDDDDDSRRKPRRRSRSRSPQRHDD